VPEELVKQIMTWGPPGVFLLLILLGVLVPRRELTKTEQEAERWRSMYEQESQAHGLTQQALSRERERMDAALESSRTTAMMLQYLGHQPMILPNSVAPSPSGGGSP